MITWVNVLFVRWGQWVQLGHGLGSKGLSPAWGAVGGRGLANHVPTISIECSRVHDWVLTLGRPDQTTMLVCYASPGSSREHAIALGQSLRTMYLHQHTLQKAYAEHLEPRRSAQKSGLMPRPEKKVSAPPPRRSSEAKRPRQVAVLLKI